MEITGTSLEERNKLFKVAFNISQSVIHQLTQKLVLLFSDQNEYVTQ